MPEVAVGFEHSMPSDHRARLQRFDFIERGQPVEAALLVRLCQEEMSTVIDGIPADFERDRSGGTMLGGRPTAKSTAKSGERRGL
jgi:hypothetical protein